MQKTSRCQLTAKDASILEVMLERRGRCGDAFTRLLRQKIAMTSVVLIDGVDPQAATLNSRVEYSVDGGPPCERILVYGGENAYPGMTLPITTMRGLALLGLLAPRSIICDKENGRVEEIRLLRVLYQPETGRRRGSEFGAVRAVTDRRCDVVPLQPRSRLKAIGAGYDDDDDPGPAAA